MSDKPTSAGKAPDKDAGLLARIESTHYRAQRAMRSPMTALPKMGGILGDVFLILHGLAIKQARAEQERISLRHRLDAIDKGGR